MPYSIEFRANQYEILVHPKCAEIIADIQSAIDANMYSVSVRFVGDPIHPENCHYAHCAKLTRLEYLTANFIWQYDDPTELLANIQILLKEEVS